MRKDYYHNRFFGSNFYIWKKEKYDGNYTKSEMIFWRIKSNLLEINKAQAEHNFYKKMDKKEIIKKIDGFNNMLKGIYKLMNKYGYEVIEGIELLLRMLKEKKLVENDNCPCCDEKIDNIEEYSSKIQGFDEFIKNRNIRFNRWINEVKTQRRILKYRLEMIEIFPSEYRRIKRKARNQIRMYLYSYFHDNNKINFVLEYTKKYKKEKGLKY